MVSCCPESDLFTGVPTLLFLQDLKPLPPCSKHLKLQHRAWCDANSLKVSEEVRELSPTQHIPETSKDKNQLIIHCWNQKNGEGVVNICC